MLLMVKGPVPELVNVTFCAELVICRGWFPKERLVGFSVTAGVPIPVPDRAAVAGEFGSLLDTLKLADLAPVVVGLKVTLMIQNELVPKVAGQLFDWVKSPGLVPVKEIELMDKVAAPTLVKVTACDELGTPTA